MFLVLNVQVLVEFDDVPWQKREWIKVSSAFQEFLVEHTLVWVQRRDPDHSDRETTIRWPALVRNGADPASHTSVHTISYNFTHKGSNIHQRL